MHKKGVVHRDLYPSNLLLDRNRNIVIGGFSHARTFNPDDELGDEIDNHLSDPNFVKRTKLEHEDKNGQLRGDLMGTRHFDSEEYFVSEAPESFSNDSHSLYMGRRADVWSCGVVLYCILAGLIPWNDYPKNPKNPDRDNGKLFHEYVVSTPLNFPERVTAPARDLLRRMLTIDPRKRADLFEVARHVWLSEYSHVLEPITSLGDKP